MNKELLSFSVDNFSIDDLQDVSDTQFMKGHMRFFADGVNRNGYYFTLKSIKKAGKTIRGKPLLVAFNIWNSDGLGGHDKDEIPVGYVPNNAEITYEESDDGRTFICTDFYIWKNYSKDLPDILSDTDDGIKEVSVELWALDTTEDKENNYIIVNDFVFCGTTILSQDITPAVPDAKLQILKFSEKSKGIFDKLEESLNCNIRKLNNSINQESDEGSFLIQKNSENKEETMAKKVTNAATETPEVLENGTKYTTTNVGVSEYTDTYDDNGNFVESTSEYHSRSETTVEHTEDTPTEVDNAASTDENKEEVDNAVPENNSCETVEEKCSALEVKCSALEAELNTLKNTYSALELKCASLEQYKTNKENEEKTLAIECALNDVADILSAKEIEQWREKSLTCSSVDGFKNELKAFAFDIQKKNGVKPVETLRNSIPVVQEEESTNVWDRLAKTV